ncbi:MAG: M48 family metalloprotease [Hyphomicrobiaceae bacterium]
MTVDIQRLRTYRSLSALWLGVLLLSGVLFTITVVTFVALIFEASTISMFHSPDFTTTIAEGFGAAIAMPIAGFVAGTAGHLLSRNSVIRGFKAEPLDPDHVAWQITRKLAASLDIPAPPLFIYPDPDLNAWAAGTRNHAAVAFSSGLLYQMRQSPAELAAIIAHELAHITNGDMRAQQVGSSFQQTMVFYVSFSRRLSQSMRWFTSWVGEIGLRAHSRNREYWADAVGGVLVGKGPMIAALQRIQSQQEAVPLNRRSYRNRLFSWRSESLFATHPSIEKRITALQQDTYTQLIRGSDQVQSQPRKTVPTRYVAGAAIVTIVTIVGTLLGTWLFNRQTPSVTAAHVAVQRASYDITAPVETATINTPSSASQASPSPSVVVKPSGVAPNRAEIIRLAALAFVGKDTTAPIPVAYELRAPNGEVFQKFKGTETITEPQNCKVRWVRQGTEVDQFGKSKPINDDYTLSVANIEKAVIKMDTPNEVGLIWSFAAVMYPKARLPKPVPAITIQLTSETKDFVCTVGCGRWQRFEIVNPTVTLATVKAAYSKLVKLCAQT